MKDGTQRTSEHSHLAFPETKSVLQLIERALEQQARDGRRDPKADAALDCARERPNEREVWCALGQMMVDQRKPVIASDCYALAVQIEPRDAATRAMLAICLAQQGRFEEAETEFRHSLGIDPNRPATHYNFGVAFAERGRLREAELAFREAVRLLPEYAEAHRALGRVLEPLGRNEEAAESLRRASRLRPEDLDVLTELGMLLAKMGKTADEASVLLRHVTRIRPQSADAFNSLGLAQMAMGRFVEAETSYERALSIDARFGAAHSNLGTNFKEQGRLCEAIASYDLALRLQPDSVPTHWNRALALLQNGDYEQGWNEYEWRWKRETSPMRKFSKPMYAGENLAGKRLLLWPEQGLGDLVQFGRYAAAAKDRGANVILECPMPMASLMRTCRGVDQVVPETIPLPDYDFHLPVMSGPLAFGTTNLKTIPGQTPYLEAHPELVEKWSKRIKSSGLKAFRVGIAWQGNPHHPLDRFRSARLEDFSPLSRMKGVQLYSLQRGPGTEQLDRWKSDMGVIELTRREVVGPEDWAETAAIIMNMDLIVTVDTATAHVSSALGQRTWIALAASPDWRWLQRRSDTPWYPTARLFRQNNLNGWSKVFQAIQQELLWTSEATWSGSLKH